MWEVFENFEGDSGLDDDLSHNGMPQQHQENIFQGKEGRHRGQETM